MYTIVYTIVWSKVHRILSISSFSKTRNSSTQRIENVIEFPDCSLSSSLPFCLEQYGGKCSLALRSPPSLLSEPAEPLAMESTPRTRRVSSSCRSCAFFGLREGHALSARLGYHLVRTVLRDSDEPGEIGWMGLPPVLFGVLRKQKRRPQRREPCGAPPRRMRIIVAHNDANHVASREQSRDDKYT